MLKVLGGGQLRATLVALFAAAFVLAVIPEAAAQKGGGMGGGGVGGSGGGGSHGGGTKGSRGGNKPKAKRNEQPPVDPQVSRTKLQESLQTGLTRGTLSTPFLVNLFDQASTQPIPASSQARKALADALSVPLKGKKLEAANATAIAEVIAIGVNIDGVPAEELPTKRDAMKEALGTAGLTEEQSTAALAAFDRVVMEQQNEKIKSVSDLLEEIQKDGQFSDDQKTKLADAMTALVDGEAKAEASSVQGLAGNMGKALDAAQLTNKEKAQLAFDLKQALSGAMASAEFQPLLLDVRTIMKNALAKQADIQTVATDLQNIQKAMAGS